MNAQGKRDDHNDEEDDVTLRSFCRRTHANFRVTMACNTLRPNGEKTLLGHLLRINVIIAATVHSTLVNCKHS